MLLSYNFFDDFIELLIKNKYKQNNDTVDTSIIHKIISRLFLEMEETIVYVESIFLKTDIIFREKTKKDRRMIYRFLRENHYLNHDIRTFINNEKFYIIEYHYKNYHFTFIDYNKDLSNLHHSDNNINTLIENMDIYAERFKQLLTITIFLEKYKRESCRVKQLSTYIFLTPFNKLLPPNDQSIISGENINSGYTVPCSTETEIFIWRREEYFKVYIHELMHAMGIDFATMNSNRLKHYMSSLFPTINGEFNMFESYADIWALILNNMFFVITNLESNVESKRMELFMNLYEIDKLWTIFQSTKVLKNYKINSYSELFGQNYSNDHSHNIRVREKTNAFAYFIGKTILMISLEDFLEFCDKKNIITFSPSNLDNKFFDFIKSHSHNKELLHLYEFFYKLLNNKHKYKHKDKNDIMNSMRWSCLEWI